MKCPSCAFENESGAQACNLCGKLLITKPTPAPAAPPPAPAPSKVLAAVAYVAEGGINAEPGRVPSWANQAIFCFLLLPSIQLIALPFLLQPRENEGPEYLKWIQVAWTCVASAICLAATVPLAARLSFAPLVASAFAGLLLFLTLAFNPVMLVLCWIVLGGPGLAWVGRSTFTRDWDLANLPLWALQGYRRLLAPDRWAALRLIGGIVLFLGGIGFMIATGTALKDSIPITRAWAKVLAIPAFIGGFVAASALAFTEPREGH